MCFYENKKKNEILFQAAFQASPSESDKQRYFLNGTWTLILT